MIIGDEDVLPFLKWPGGKRWLIPMLNQVLSKIEYNNYFEPFLGGASVFFSLVNKSACLSDSNSDLINLYQVVKEFPHEIISKIKEMPIDKDNYYQIRNSSPTDSIDKAARLLYLNRTAFGGMYRVNKLGRFNVPYGGRSTDILWEKNLVLNASNKLSHCQLSCRDFSSAFELAKDGDLIYCDPPYTVSHNTNGFQRYNENIFNWNDQIRLKDLCVSASLRGVNVIVSNAAHRSILELYQPLSPIVFSRYSGLSTNPHKRGLVDEYVFLFKKD
tara:strand:- start:1300 stop:2118 length:819 start_codon:yes stop_codon:yes gene_type:complete